MGERSGTETRKRQRQVAVRLSDDELAHIQKRADEWKVSVPHLLRWAALDWELIPHAQAHTLDADCWCGPVCEVVP